ncbi:MAG: Uma2 family endonuclease [Myxococcaceae bacterium]|nr:Uma2 family endonuclease [Myxococcaceae bacterium]MCI0671464.1 Uma2 family endonuclease [Myxococcaceae bacterium]
MRAEDGMSEELIRLPRALTRFPVELVPPRGFRPHRLETWPRMDGRMEWVGGRLLYMPPTGESQAGTVSDVNLVVGLWGRKHPEVFVGTNEPGMLLGEDVRAADVAVWKRSDTRGGGHQLLRRPPILAVEVAGRDESEAALTAKARWYLRNGVQVVWLVLPDSQEVVVMRPRRSSRHRVGEVVPAHPALPGLTPAVAEFFRQMRKR